MTSLDFQLALRNYETYLINAAFEYMNQDKLDENKEVIDQDYLKSTKGTLKLKIIDETKMAFYEENSMKIPGDALNFIVNEYEPIQESINSEEYIDLKYFSEYKKNNKIFRAHPNYKQEGKWYDWVMIRWEKDLSIEQPAELSQQCHLTYSETEEDRKREYLYSPGQILCFTSPKEGVYHAIVKCCDYAFERGSVFSTTWKQEYVSTESGNIIPRICCVDVKSIVRHVLMIPSNPFDGTYYQVWDKCHWGEEFCIH